VIYKSRIKCDGSCGCASTQTVQVKGALFFAAAPYDGYSGVTWVKKFESTQTSVVVVNGGFATLYHPPIPHPGFKGTGYWQGTSVLMIGGVFQNSATSYAVWKSVL